MYVSVLFYLQDTPQLVISKYVCFICNNTHIYTLRILNIRKDALCFF